MKILFVNIPAAREDSEEGKLFKKHLFPLWKRNIDLVKQKDTEVTVRVSPWGMAEMDAVFYGFYDHLGSKMIYYSAAAAEKEGFDAVVIACFGDPMGWEMRQALNIPVVTIGESSMLLATVMGYKFGVVTISPFNIPGQEHRILKYGLKERSVGVRAIAETSDEQMMALIDARHTIDCFKKVARELIADGAEIIVPGCSLMSPAMRLAPGAEKEYPNGLTEVDGVPVADVIGDTVKLAETLADLKRGGSSWVSRKALYATASPRANKLGKTVTSDDMPKFWDYKL